MEFEENTMVKPTGDLIGFKTLYYSSKSIIYKAFNVKTKQKVIIKTLNKNLDDEKSLSKLKNEFRLLQKLQGQYVVKAYEFLNLENHFSIIMEDFEATSLDRYLNNNQIEMREFLYIALEITKCIDYIHQHHVIHKDINPSNIVYNPYSKILKLIDFGTASEFSFETIAALNPNKLEGRLPYISPEQTGRMNRPLDYRTDFYSLGITLYELACRRLPFASDDPAELVYSHIAEMPRPVHEENPDIPKTVSKIIAKLMAKMPEERYKNAQGIMFDLAACIEQMDNRGTVAEFELGGRDISDKFEVPKRLYGRKHELKTLFALFEKISKGDSDLVLINGYAGVGKTSLVNELNKPIMKEHGIFIYGKYDQFNRNTPYSACFQAIDQFCNYILSEPEIEIEGWKKRISSALGANGRLITEAVPRLGAIIGEQPVLGGLSSIDKQIRFKIALKSCLEAISAPEHPVVFFADDVHWADMASLDLFDSLVIDQNIKGLMFIGTYRANEVDPSHPLIRTIEKIKNNNGKVKIIELENLSIDAVAQMIAGILSRPEQEVLQLAKFIHTRTLGNPFYTIEFLKYCYEYDLLYYSASKMKWQWDETAICSSPISDNVAYYLIERIKTLPDSTRNLIKFAACIGNRFDIRVLAAITDQDIDTIKNELKPAINEEMVHVADNKEHNTEKLYFKFCHDRFQQAGYQALSEDIKKTVHLRIARYYENNEVLDGTCLFTVADHLSKGLDCLISNREKEDAVEIFFKATHAANLSSAYDTARQYIEIIMRIAPEELKKRDTFLLRLYTEYHLVLFSLARFEELDNTYLKIEEICSDPLDLVDCCCLQLISLSNRSRYQEGFLLGIALLEKLGIQYPGEKLQDAVEKEYAQYCEYENNGSFENIEKMEMWSDARGNAIAKLLNRIVPAAQFFNPLAAFWANLVNANLMAENGVTGVALEMSWGFFMGVIAYKNDFRCGNILADKAMNIIKRKGFNAELYRMYHVKGLVWCHWFESLEKDIYYAHEAYKGNLQHGEFEFSCYSFFTSLTGTMECCNTLAELQEEAEAALFFATRMGNLYGLQSFVSYQQMIKALRGETLSYGSFNDNDFNEDKHVKAIQKNSIGLAYYYIYRSLSAVIFNDFRTAFELTEKAIPLLPFIASFYTSALLRFLHSLAICRIIKTRKNCGEESRLKRVLEQNQQWMYERSQDAPFNFQHLYNLIDAEMKVLAGEYDECFRLYEKSIIGARTNKRPYHYALACELAGQCYLQTGIDRAAAFYIRESYSAYLAWGAGGKIKAMQEQYKNILFSGIDNAKFMASNPQITLSASSDNMTALNDSIDLNAVIKATQAIASEIDKKKLLQIIMTIIMENSGSNCGSILIYNNDGWILSTYAIKDKSINIIIDDEVITLEDSSVEPVVPLSLINYVIRTQEPVIIGNMADSYFAIDKYYLLNPTSSAICFPIIYQSAMKGIVYLENNLLTDAYIQERLAVLNIFASQAAIALENSRLYSELEEKVRERTKQLEKANLSLKERTEELAVAMAKTKAANRQLAAKNIQLKHENILRKLVEEEQKISLKKFKLSEERFANLFHDSPIMMSIRAQNGNRFIDVNSKWEELTGYSKKRIIGSCLYDLNLFNPTQWSEAIEELNQNRDTEIAIQTKTGEILDLIISQKTINFNNEDCWLTVSLDITERKKMEQEMARLDRLNLIGEMAASIGHEIRNPMTSVRGFLQMFTDKYSDDREFLGLMIEELDRANGIITEFLSLAKNKVVELVPHRLNAIVKSILPLVQATAILQDKNIAVEMERLPELLLDKKEIRQLILNLVHNGLEAMAAGGTVTIRTFSEGESIVLSIQDQGKGIESEVLNKLGTPFFTTKEKGTGLGLAVCYGIASRHRASINIETGNKGTTVSIRFPLPAEIPAETNGKQQNLT